MDLCKRRGVYVNAELLSQFITQVTDEESADEELSLDQLEDVAGGLGVTDVMVSGVVLAVVASNAGGFISQAQAATGVGSDGPVASLTADASIAGQMNTLESLGIQVRADSKYATSARGGLSSSGSMAAVIPSPCPKPQLLQLISI